MRIEFARPEILYLVALLPLWIGIIWPRAGRGVFFPRGHPAARRAVGATMANALVLALPRLLRGMALVALIVALAGPERVDTVQETELEGKGIGLVVDLSSSMLAEDMGERASRIEVARDAAIRFARRRPYDELSLVAFGGEALTRIPPTTDRELVAHGVESLEVQLVRDGTDISGAVLTAVNRLLASDREPRVVVLLTDGAHNGVELPPLAAARAAAALDVRIHAISVLSPEDPSRRPDAPIGRQRLAVERETVLQGLAGLTGGRYFLASGPEALDSIYSEIDRIEAPVERSMDVEERHPLRGWLFLTALGLLGVELLLRGSRWGVIP